MSDTFDTTTLDEAAPRRLVRVDDGRWLGGVSAGLGRYFDVNPLVYRIAFVALAFVGGTGLLLYLAAWLVIPAEDREESIAVEALRLHRDRPWLLLGVALLFFGALLALSEARVWPGLGNVWLAALLGGAALVWWHVSGTRDRTHSTTSVPQPAMGEQAPAAARPAPPPRKPSLFAPVLGTLLGAAGLFGLLAVLDVYDVDVATVLAVAVVGVGAAVVAGAVLGRRVGALVLLGLLLLACFGVAAALPVSLSAGIGDRNEVAFDQSMVERQYELGIGDLTVDLSRVDLQRPTRVEADLGMGHLLVRVPPDVAVDVDAHTAAGDVQVFGIHDEGAGADVDRFFPGATADAPVLMLEADVGLGDLVIERG
jgi:phage shock protein PspC (stress-responsive transcriptional regulator)